MELYGAGDWVSDVYALDHGAEPHDIDVEGGHEGKVGDSKTDVVEG